MKSLRWSVRGFAALSFSLVVGAALAQPAPDVPQGHWAYGALENLMGKVLFGYPDGLYRGTRPMSRYEFAVAVNQLWTLAMGKTGDLEEAIKKLNVVVGGIDSSGSDPSLLRDVLAKLAERISKSEADRAALLKLTEEFEVELTTLGANVDGMKSSLGKLSDRVTALENRKNSVKIGGDLTIAALGGFSRDNRPGLTTAGFTTGLGRGSYNGNAVGINRDLLAVHEAAIDLESEQSRGVKLKGTFVLGNAVDTFGGLSGGRQGSLPVGESDAAVYQLYGYVPFKGLRGKGDFTLGRFGHQAPLIFQRFDNTPFWDNARWDSRDYLVDGARLSFDWDTTQLHIFTGRTSLAKTLDGDNLTQPVINILSVERLPVDRVLGANTTIQLRPGAYIQGGYIYSDSDTKYIPRPISRMISLGGSMHLLFGPVSVDAGMAKNILKFGGSTVIDNDNETYFAALGVPLGNLRLSGGYKRVEPISFLNGDWGKIGAIQNPTGYTSTRVAADLTTGFGSVGGFVENAQGVDPGPSNPVGTAGLRRGDKVQQWGLHGAVKLRDSWQLTLDYIDAQWKLPGADPSQTFFTFGLKGSVGRDAKLGFGLQLSDADGKGLAFMDRLGMAGRYKGGLLFSQFSVKF